MIKNLEQYAESLNSREDVLVWLRTTGLKNLKYKKVTESQLEHIIDFFNSEVAPKRLQKMSLKDAKRKTEQWTEANKKKGKNLQDTNNDIKVIHTFEDGSKIVQLLTKAAFQREGFLMSHCLGGYNPNEQEYDIYSYRDNKNMPHATFEVRKNSDEIIQIKGKGNGSIHPKYIQPVLTFLEILGINIRTSEMKNLGYYHINKEHLDFIYKFENARLQVVKVRGEYYAR